MNFVNLVREEFAREILMFTALSPLLIMGMRNSPAGVGMTSGGWKFVGWSVLLLVLTNTATGIDWLQPAGLKWNWSGKSLCIATTLIFYCFLPSEIRRRSGLFNLPDQVSSFAVIGFLTYCLAIGLLGGYAGRIPFDSERVAFQLVMPSLAEEPVYRGILPALLMCAWAVLGNSQELNSTGGGLRSPPISSWDTRLAGHPRERSGLTHSISYWSRFTSCLTVGSQPAADPSGPASSATAWTTPSSLRDCFRREGGSSACLSS